jgi:hypothetical protein
LLQKHSTILRTRDVLPKPTRGVEHHIHIGSYLLFFLKSCCLDSQKLEIVKAEFKRLESAGIICRSNLPWASPLHMVPKQDRSWRPCGNYRCLNLTTTPDKYRYPSQTCNTFQTAWMVAQFFTKSILSRGITKFQLPQRISPKQPSSPLSVCSNICSPLLAYQMLSKLFKE